MRNSLVIILVFTIFTSCSHVKTAPKYIFNEGPIFGTMYHISYESPDGKDFSSEIQEELNRLDGIFSSYKEESQLSKVNRNEAVDLDTTFGIVFNEAYQIAELSDGAFDVTVAPLVNAWGFGFKKKENVTPEMIDSLKTIVDYRKVRFVDGKIIKDDPRISLDLSSLAEGYGVDAVGILLSKKGCKNYMIEIGGEVLAHGVNKEGNPWRIGINEANDNEPTNPTSLQAIVSISNKAISTSGNYRKFYIENGKKFAHTIDPATGYPVEHNLLSATVIADNCMAADAWSTAFMVLGVEKSMKIAALVNNIELFLIYADKNNENQVLMTKGFEKYLMKD